MPTPSSLVQLKLEETPRPENAATTTPYRIATDAVYLPITSTSFAPNPSFIDRADEIRGTEGAVSQLIDGYAPAGDIAVRGYANPLTWLLTCAGFTATKTAGDGVITDPDAQTIPAGANRWVFTKRAYTSSTQQARSMQILLAYVTEGQFVTGQGVGVNSLTMNAAGDVTAGLTGLVYVPTTTDPNVTPAYDVSAIPFFRRGDITLTWLTNTATTDDFSFSIANDLAANRPLGSASYFPSELNPGDARVRVTGSIPKYRLGNADLTALLNGSTFSAKVRWQSPKVIGATAYKYSMWLEMPACQYTGGGPAALTNSRRVGASFDWTAAWDETAGYDAKITLVNAVTSIGAPFNSTNVGV